MRTLCRAWWSSPELTADKEDRHAITPLMSRSAVSPEQRRLYDDMRNGIEANFKAFIAIDEAGRLIGPWKRRVWAGTEKRTFVMLITF
jgi:hypothetical protein